MLIILEGVDGAGKTTFADALLEAHDGPSSIMHCGPLKRDALMAYEWEMRNYDRTDLSHLRVCDRWHVGELIYGPLYRGKSKLTSAMRKHVELYLESRGAVRVVVTAAVESIRRRLRERGEDLLDESHLGLVWDFYREYANDHGWMYLSNNYPAEALVEEARLQQEEVFQLGLVRSYVGPSRPEYLLVGRNNTDRLGHVYHPSAYAPMSGSAGAYLMHCLIEAGAEGYGLLDLLTDRDLNVAHTILRKPKVIALGAEGRQACQQAGITPWHSAPAPHTFDDKLYDKIKEAVRR